MITLTHTEFCQDNKKRISLNGHEMSMSLRVFESMCSWQKRDALQVHSHLASLNPSWLPASSISLLWLEWFVVSDSSVSLVWFSENTSHRQLQLWCVTLIWVHTEVHGSTLPGNRDSQTASSGVEELSPCNIDPAVIQMQNSSPRSKAANRLIRGGKC